MSPQQQPGRPLDEIIGSILSNCVVIWVIVNKAVQPPFIKGVIWAICLTTIAGIIRRAWNKTA
jgi:hypothetical protein